MNCELQTLPPSPHITGVVKRIVDFPSQFVDSRHIDIWLPPSYDVSDQSYPVLYVQDGQNLFEPYHSFTNESWEADETVRELIEENKIREPIIVAIWNSDKRFREYQPNKAVEMDAAVKERLEVVHNGRLLGDSYLKFITSELKPFIDREFRTLPDKANSFMMGSSMGGAITIYALAQYPDIFGGVACLSTHFLLALENDPTIAAVFIRYLKEQLPKAGTHKIYFDYGTETLDAWYEPYQQQMDVVMAELGYAQGVDWVTKKFEGAEHSEIAWRKRLHIPLTFLLGNAS